jgi:flagellar biosynthesis/type III secretory pathway M-ring protein FliF/YscJ
LALGAIAVSGLAMTELAGNFLSMPAAESVYAGLGRRNGGRIAEALNEADIPFDVNSDRNTCGQITMRKVDGWESLAERPSDQIIDLAA